MEHFLLMRCIISCYSLKFMLISFTVIINIVHFVHMVILFSHFFFFLLFFSSLFLGNRTPC